MYAEVIVSFLRGRDPYGGKPENGATCFSVSGVVFVVSR